MHLSQTGPWGGSTVCDTGCRATLHITPVIYFGTLAGPCHSGSCFLHKHRRVAVIIKTNWLLNVLYITGLSKSWVVCSCHSSGHCGQSFPAHQDCLFLKPSTFLFRIKTCFVILFLSSPVPFQGYAKEKCTHVDGERVRGWLVFVENTNAEFRGRNNPPDPAVWVCTLGWGSPLSLSPVSLKYSVTCPCTVRI